MNLKMADFKQCLESAGYNKVKTVLSSGNAAFDSSSKSAAVIERQIEAAFTKQLGRSFYTIVRSVEELQDLIERDPYSRFALPSNAKRTGKLGVLSNRPMKPTAPFHCTFRVFAMTSCRGLSRSS